MTPVQQEQLKRLTLEFLAADTVEQMLVMLDAMVDQGFSDAPYALMLIPLESSYGKPNVTNFEANTPERTRLSKLVLDLLDAETREGVSEKHKQILDEGFKEAGYVLGLFIIATTAPEEDLDNLFEKY